MSRCLPPGCSIPRGCSNLPPCCCIVKPCQPKCCGTPCCGPSIPMCGIACPRPDPRCCPRPISVSFAQPTASCPWPKKEGEEDLSPRKVPCPVIRMDDSNKNPICPRPKGCCECCLLTAIPYNPQPEDGNVDNIGGDNYDDASNQVEVTSCKPCCPPPLPLTPPVRYSKRVQKRTCFNWNLCCRPRWDDRVKVPWSYRVKYEFPWLAPVSCSYNKWLCSQDRRVDSNICASLFSSKCCNQCTVEALPPPPECDPKPCPCHC